jgi:hypothetical protein
MTTPAEAVEQILTIFKTAWDGATSSAPVMYQNISNVGKPDDETWTRVMVQHQDGAQVTLRAESGERRFRSFGLFTAQIFTPIGEGLTSSLALGKVIKNALEGVTTSGGVIFRNVRLVDVGSSGNHYQTNVLADFEYDEVR